MKKQNRCSLFNGWTCEWRSLLFKLAEEHTWLENHSSFNFIQTSLPFFLSFFLSWSLQFISCCPLFSIFLVSRREVFPFVRDVSVQVKPVSFIIYSLHLCFKRKKKWLNITSTSTIYITIFSLLFPLPIKRSKSSLKSELDHICIVRGRNDIVFSSHQHHLWWRGANWSNQSFYRYIIIESLSILTAWDK